jgi:hypothetical protein
MAVSKSATGSCQDKIIGRRRDLSRYQMVLIENETVPELVECWAGCQGSRKFCCHQKFIWVRREANCHNCIFTNGPPVELVSVAERLEAVTTNVLFLLRAGSRHTAGRSEARRGFCKSRHKVSKVYVCRVTRFIVSRLLVKVLLFY